MLLKRRYSKGTLKFNLESRERSNPGRPLLSMGNTKSYNSQIPYVGKFWRGKILANGPLPIFINTTKYLNTIAGMLKPKQRHEDNHDEEKPKGHEYYRPL